MQRHDAGRRRAADVDRQIIHELTAAIVERSEINVARRPGAIRVDGQINADNSR